VGEFLRRAGLSRDGLRVIAFLAPLFAAAGISMPFIPLFFEARGLSAADIGLMMGIGMWVRFGGHMTAGWVADRLGERRRVLFWLAVMAFAVSIAYWPMEGFWQIAPVFLIGTLVISPMFSLGENLALLAVKGRGLDYGRVRLWGSVSFMLVTYGAGLVLVGRSADWVLWMLIVCHAAMIGGAYLLPDVRTEKRESRTGSALTLLGMPLFWLFLATSGAIQTSHGVYYAFSTLYWRDAGLSEAMIGVLWAIGIVAEIGLFAVATRLTTRLAPAMLMTIGGLGAVLRWSLTAVTIEPVALVFLQMLHGLSFCATHLGAMQFIVRAIPDSLSASAQSLHSALAIGGLMGISMTAGGYVFAQAGGASAFLLMAGFAGAGVVLSLVLARRWNGGPIL